jgi:hypothetical protein
MKGNLLAAPAGETHGGTSLHPQWRRRFFACPIPNARSPYPEEKTSNKKLKTDLSQPGFGQG